MHERAVEDKEKPYVGAREIAHSTGTSTKTFYRTLPELLRVGAVKPVEIGKRTKYHITETGEKYRFGLDHSRSYEEMLMSKDSSFLVVEDLNPKAGATAYYEPGNLSQEKMKDLHERFRSLLDGLQKDFPKIRIRAILTSNPSNEKSEH